MFKIARTTQKYQYSEMEQPNKIRFQIYYLDGDTLHPQTGKMKCRDFFNDIVATRKGINFFIYGMDNRTVKTNEDGVWIKLTGLDKSFHENFDKWLKTVFEEVSGQDLVYETVGRGFFLKLPAFFFEKTYYVSLATLLIRLSNYGKVWGSLDECLQDSANYETQVCVGMYYHKLKEVKFDLPEQFKDKWWWANQHYHSDNSSLQEYQLPSLIHNSGIQCYLRSI